MPKIPPEFVSVRGDQEEDNYFSDDKEDKSGSGSNFNSNGKK